MSPPMAETRERLICDSLTAGARRAALIEAAEMAELEADLDEMEAEGWAESGDRERAVAARATASALRALAARLRAKAEGDFSR